MILTHFLPGINGICNDDFAIERHLLLAFIAILRINCEGSNVLWNLVELNDVLLGLSMSRAYGTEDQNGILAWQEAPGANTMWLPRECSVCN